MNKQKIQDKIAKLQEELKQLEAKEEEEKNKVSYIVIDGWAYETKEHDFNKKLSDIKIPEGKELLLPSECFRFYEDKDLRKKLNLLDCWFFVKQIRENTSDVAGFCTYSDGVDFRAGYYSGSSGPSLGIRYKWRIKK